MSFFDRRYLAFAGVAAWRNDASAGCPTQLTMAADREQYAAPNVLKSQPCYTLWENRRVVSRDSRHAKLR